MANWYVWSGAAGTGTGADWTNAYVRLRLALTAKAAGDTFFVAHDHAETEATAIAMTSPGTEALPCRVYCVNRAGSVPPVGADLLTTATITCTGAGITCAGSVCEFYGISLIAAGTISLVNTASRTWRYVNCLFRITATGASIRIHCGLTTTSGITLENCSFRYANSGQFGNAVGRVTVRNRAAAILDGAGTQPTQLFATDINPVFLMVEGVNFENNTGEVIDTGSTFHANATIKDCKIGSGVITRTAVNGCDNHLVSSDSGDTSHRFEKKNAMAELTTETTIVRSGGASNGTTPVAWKIVTTTSPWSFECPPILIWNETTGASKTVTVDGIWGGGSTPLDKDIWIEVYYLGTSGFPLATRASSHPGTLALHAGTNLAAGSGTWGGSTTQFKMAVTFTPQEKGPFTVYVKTQLVSSTFYIDPKPVVT